jgi:hypothetical protein
MIPLFRPNHKYKLFWDLLLLFMTIMQILKISIELSFNMNFSQQYITFSYLNQFIFVLYIMNALITLNTSFFKNGSIIKSRTKILENYLQENLVIDSLSIAYTSFEFLFVGTSKFFAISYFVNLKRVYNLLKNFKETYEIPEIGLLLMIALKSLLLAHFIACIWHSIGSSNFYENNKNWLFVQGLENSIWYEKYFASLYWAIITLATVGYGDITPQNMIERIFCSIVCMIGTMMFGYGINSIGMIIQSIAEKGKELKYNFFFIHIYK